jgi:hypothetical protein
MKKTLLTTAAFLAMALPALSGPTENITGCATVPVPGANYTNFADPTCYSAPEESGMDPIFVEVVRSISPDPDDEEGDDTTE